MGGGGSEKPVPVGEECIRVEGSEFGSDHRRVPRGVKPKILDLGYSDFELWVGDTVFKTHRHQLVKFGSFAKGIRHASSNTASTRSLRLEGDERDVEDMVNTFKILYASMVHGPSEFEPPVLISAFRVAKAYDYPELRTYCIERLEECEEYLTPMQRIELARAFDPNSREVATYDAMCKRDKPFTEAETRILGMLAWSMIARARKPERAKNDSKADGVRTPEYEALEAWGRKESSVTRESSEGGRKWAEATREREERAVDEVERKKRGKEREEAEIEERKEEDEGTSKQHQKRRERERDGKSRRVSERRNKEGGEREVETRRQSEPREEPVQSVRVDVVPSTKERVGRKQKERREMERKELEERERGYEEALKQHQKRQKWDEHKRKLRETGDHLKDDGGSGATSSTFSALLAHHRAMARFDSESPDPMMDALKLESHDYDAEGDSTNINVAIAPSVTGVETRFI